MGGMFPGLFGGDASGGTDPAIRGAAVYSLTQMGLDALGRDEGNAEQVMVMQTLENLNQATSFTIAKEAHKNQEGVQAIINQLVYNRYVRKIN